jgi:hypothetical protein
MTTKELTGCFQPNEVLYVCREEIPIYTYIPELDCEAIPQLLKFQVTVNTDFFKLSETCWISLHMSNQWLFVTPQTETFTIFYPQETTILTLQKDGKLTLRAGCKGYSSYVTLYAVSTLTTNVTNDYVPSAPVDFDCCFQNLKKM